MQRPLPTLCSLLVAFPALASDVPRRACFPIENLPPQLQSRAEKIFLDTLDSVALYTVIDGLKPVTTDLDDVAVVVHRNLQNSTAIADLERIASAFHCGDEVQMFVCIGCNQYPPKAELYVANRPAIAAVIQRRAELFTPLGVTPLTPPPQVLYLAERFLLPDPREVKSNVDDAVRHTAIYGLLFGYPEYAVASYGAGFRRGLTGERPAELSPSTLPKKPPIIDILGYNKRPRSFVYRVEENHIETEEDRQLRTSAEAILSEYTKRREKDVGTGKPGVIHLLRDWFCDASGYCSAARASVIKRPLKGRQ